MASTPPGSTTEGLTDGRTMGPASRLDERAHRQTQTATQTRVGAVPMRGPARVRRDHRWDVGSSRTPRRYPRRRAHGGHAPMTAATTTLLAVEAIEDRARNAWRRLHSQLAYLPLQSPSGSWSYRFASMERRCRILAARPEESHRTVRTHPTRHGGQIDGQRSHHASGAGRDTTRLARHVHADEQLCTRSPTTP